MDVSDIHTSSVPYYLQTFIEGRSDLLEPDSDSEMDASSTSSILFDTPYGLRVTKFEEGGGVRISISLDPSLANAGVDSEADSHDYSIFPSWETSFFYEGSDEKDYNFLFDSYPAIANDFDDWRADAQIDFDQRLHDIPEEECYLSGPEVLMGWKIQGFLMACWLVLQPNISSVEYTTSWYMYELTKDNLDRHFFNLLSSNEEPSEYY
ncbi:hypothetical protein F4781DRAFT_408704 [Annulohypoxylon bovei var. microspora]|nr:hypothetical protein F4781DRAFT_408704 [Annulohypoxylon bovei var. microspora]